MRDRYISYDAGATWIAIADMSIDQLMYELNNIDNGIYAGDLTPDLARERILIELVARELSL